MNKAPAPILDKRFHDLHLWFVLFAFFVAVALPFKWYTVIAWAAVICVTALLQGVRIQFAFKALCIAFGLSISIWLLNVFFHTEDSTQTEALQQANQIALKVWAMTWVALLSSKMINMRDVITCLLQKGWLSMQIAYATMVGVGSIDLMRAEVRRISLNARLRGLNWRQRFLQWLPLLVFALRHAQRGAMSLRARGLSDRKSFYYDYQATRTQQYRMLILCTLFIAVTLACELSM
ncbi:energy-coupling factor transporter transmembrane component T family protein [Hydromonas duriensis]|uniref:Energy-coupling factor transporter transmembrane protein EcfT n=1 Tax=Hydromonas duriensis TaxID=1527608 RepID=A0A4R6YB54_9BURK|nr:energy-coupling factor transporter transmembrane component T [Hydromonas duriensis]TDR32843.1 energy-coupling factor transporter transmembrane protein EcfT [Hydromonas duriensis]